MEGFGEFLGGHRVFCVPCRTSSTSNTREPWWCSNSEKSGKYYLMSRCGMLFPFAILL